MEEEKQSTTKKKTAAPACAFHFTLSLFSLSSSLFLSSPLLLFTRPPTQTNQKHRVIFFFLSAGWCKLALLSGTDKKTKRQRKRNVTEQINTPTNSHSLFHLLKDLRGLSYVLKSVLQCREMERDRTARRRSTHTHTQSSKKEKKNEERCARRAPASWFCLKVRLLRKKAVRHFSR